jgi:hypothetical protein
MDAWLSGAVLGLISPVLAARLTCGKEINNTARKL